MKLTSAITIGLLSLSSIFACANYSHQAINENNKTLETSISTANDDFEKAVALIKKYEGLHQPKHWPLIGYGHRVLPGEKYSRSRALSEKEADALLRKDLLKNCAVFTSFGADSLLMGVLAYNIGSGAALRSSVARKLKSGDRNIYDSYVAHSRYRGKTHTQIKKRRIEEFETLFIKDPNKFRETEELQIREIKTENTLKEAPQKLTNLYTPQMQYPTESTPQLHSYEKRLVASNKEATRRRKKNYDNYNTLTACILKSQQYYWL